LKVIIRTAIQLGPTPKKIVKHEIGSLPAEDIRRITWQNASELYNFAVPTAVQNDPNAY